MRSGRGALRLLLAAGLIAASAAGGFALRALRGPPPAALVQPAARPQALGLDRTPQTAPTEDGARTAAQTLPQITFTDQSGVPRRFAHWRGRPLLVNFWAPWCSPCRAETPLLERISRARLDGVQVIGVAVDSRRAVLRYARRAGIRYPLLIGTRPGMRAIRALGMMAAFPVSVFVDARGRIVTTRLGRLRAAQARLILGQIKALDRGRIRLTTARRQIARGLTRLAIRRATPPPAE